MSLVPLFDKVLVQIVTPAEKVINGIVIPESVRDTALVAKVIAAGQGNYQSGIQVPTVVKAGDTVLIPHNSHIDVKVQGRDMALINERDIFGIIVQD